MELTLRELEAAFAQVIAQEPTPFVVRDRWSGSIGAVEDNLGAGRVLVKVLEPKAWHKKGDTAIWKDPAPCGR